MDMIRRKSRDIKLGIVEALAIRNQNTDESRVLTRTGRVGAGDEGRRVSIKHTPLSEEEAARARRGSVLAVRAYEKIAVQNCRTEE